ncbi:MAG: GAF domain-containing protein [Alphaproteobacteria bacterium]|nr:GAF domain-containing protein [Alphaproteobacteria bacterium]
MTQMPPAGETGNPTASEALNEMLRLYALRDCGLLDTPDDPALDRLTAWARDYFAVPAAAVSLISADKQVLKSVAGPAKRETTRDESFCQYVVRDRKPLTIENASTDPLVRDHPAVLGEPHVRAYAGAPLRTADGFVLGAFCVFDIKPRIFAPKQLAVLAGLARVASGYVDLHEATGKAGWSGALP